MKKLTKRELRKLINESMNEGFFGSIGQGMSNMFGKKYGIQIWVGTKPYGANVSKRARSSLYYFDGYGDLLEKGLTELFQQNLPQFLSAVRKVSGINLPAKGMSIKGSGSGDVDGGSINFILNQQAAKSFVDSNPQIMKRLPLTPKSMGSGYEMYERFKETKPRTLLNLSKVLNSMGSPGEYLDKLILSINKRYSTIFDSTTLDRTDINFINSSLTTATVYIDTDMHELNI